MTWMYKRWTRMNLNEQAMNKNEPKFTDADMDGYDCTHDEDGR